MAKGGAGKSMARQAHAVLKQHLDLSSRHAAKQAQGIPGAQSTGKIHSLRTFDKYVSALRQAGQWARDTFNLRQLKEFQKRPELAQQYLQERARSGVGQKQLDADRNALRFVTGKATLERVLATHSPALSSRAYTRDQVELIARSQSERNALATRIAHTAGLRAHELHSLRPANTGQASAHRSWNADRFTGREGERYLVTGKGGLVREVSIPSALAKALESRRQDAVNLTDRKIHYRSQYDIGGGNAWSKSFSDAAKRTLGWSTGAHGLRHSYAQARLKELQNAGKTYLEARQILSQELGHFRGEIVETYLR